MLKTQEKNPVPLSYVFEKTIPLRLSEREKKSLRSIDIT
jgi:hypothetical protein